MPNSTAAVNANRPPRSAATAEAMDWLTLNYPQCKRTVRLAKDRERMAAVWQIVRRNSQSATGQQPRIPLAADSRRETLDLAAKDSLRASPRTHTIGKLLPFEEWFKCNLIDHRIPLAIVRQSRYHVVVRDFSAARKSKAFPTMRISNNSTMSSHCIARPLDPAEAFLLHGGPYFMHELRVLCGAIRSPRSRANPGFTCGHSTRIPFCAPGSAGLPIADYFRARAKRAHRSRVPRGRRQ